MAVDPASLTIAVFSLATELCRLIRAGYGFFDDFKSAGKDARALLNELDIEHRRFQGWAEAIGFSQGNSSGEQSGFRDKVVLDALCSMVLLFGNAKVLTQRYGLRKDLFLDQGLGGERSPEALAVLQLPSCNSSDTIQQASEYLTQYKEFIARTQASISVLGKCRWSLVDRDKFHKLVKTLRSKNKSLEALLTQRQRVLATEIRNHELLCTNDRGKIGGIAVAGLEDDLELAMAAAIKSRALSNLDGSTEGTGNVINREDLDLDDKHSSRPRTLALHMISGEPRARVLVEWKEKGFLSRQALDKTREAVVTEKIEKLVNLLSLKPPRAFRTLPCVGYHVAAARIGLVLELPPWASGLHLPLSLDTLLRDDKALREAYGYKPPLEARFKLAYALAQALSGLHQVDWLHKGIAAVNVLFFPKASANDIDIANPYLTGFDFSREFRDKNLSENSYDFGNSLYTHPNRFLDTEYEKSFDIYALGLLLLQIGLWETLETLAGVEVQDNKLLSIPHMELRQRLLKNCLESGKLRYRLGTGYHDAVQYCMNMGFGTSHHDEMGPTTAGSFFSMVTNNLTPFSVAT